MIISTKNLKYKFNTRDEEEKNLKNINVLDDINIEVEKGDFIAILGHNGSGKSTFAKHLNALLVPTDGTVFVDGKNTKNLEDLWNIRQACGMVFQNPDNQIIGSTVEEDVAFGPENLGIESEKICERVDEALNNVEMIKYRNKSPNKLSGGQKQRVAIASSLAMRPKCIVLDEPTAMLDPNGRKEVMNFLRQLNKNEKITIILITHHMNEAVQADKIFVIDGGKMVLKGTPREVFANVDKIKELKLDVPQITELAYEMNKKGVFDRYDIFTIDEFISEFEKNNKIYQNKVKKPSFEPKNLRDENKIILELKNVSHSYEVGTTMQCEVLKNINLKVCSDEFIGIMGHTGSGKSTLIQIMNGLINPLYGNVLYKNKNINEKGFDKKMLHCNVGLVFQYPESQLFEEDVLSDVMFGPMNKGFSSEKAMESAKRALEMLEIGEYYYKKSPFELSGGEKRRVAIAGVIAMDSEIIILDEPTAGLDPKSRINLLDCLKKLRTEMNKTIIIVSHNMEDLANYVDRLVVINNGKIEFDDNKKSVFKNVDKLESMGLGIPEITYAMRRLYKMGYNVDATALTIDEALRGMV